MLSIVLIAQVRNGGTQRSTRNVNQSRIRRIHLDDQKNRSRNRYCSNQVAGDYCCVHSGEQAEADEKGVSQKISTMSSDKDIEVAACSNINQRVCKRSNAMLDARACRERCASSFGESASILSKIDSAPVT
jgi:hypothetical protein